METHPGERRINERLDTFESLHVVTQPDLDDLVLRNRGNNSIKYVVESRKTDSLQIIPWMEHYSSHANKTQGTNLVSLIACCSRSPEPVPAHFSHTQLHLLSISWRPQLGDSSPVRQRRTWPVVMPWMHLTKRCPIPIRHQTAAAHVLERFLAYQQVPG